MIQYLIILLDDTSTSYCHYENTKKERKLISIADLKAGIFFGMKENLMIQYVYPDYELPAEYHDAIESIDHSKIKPAVCCEDANVVVFNYLDEMAEFSFVSDIAYVLRITKQDLFTQKEQIKNYLGKVQRLNIVITDVETFTDSDFGIYKSVLAGFADKLKNMYAVGKSPQLNLLTDRMMLDNMNNCGAGDSSVTLAPDGKFYVCPAFYYAGECDRSEKSLGDVCRKGYCIGSVKDGIVIKNPQLYKLDYAPLCRKCDSYQCKRCVWLNRKMCLEVNTPSHEQCVMSHIERNASRQLLADIRTFRTFLPRMDIKELKYLDPFDVRDEW